VRLKSQRRRQQAEFAGNEIVLPTDGEALDAVHKKLHSRNSTTRLFLRQLTLVREVFAENEIASPTDGRHIRTSNRASRGDNHEIA
jgi:hypothetical protein